MVEIASLYNFCYFNHNLAHKRRYFSERNVHEGQESKQTFICVNPWVFFPIVLRQKFKEKLLLVINEMSDLNHFPNNLRYWYKLLVRKFPKTTPSGFIIGITLTIWFDKNTSFYFVYSANFLRTPLQTKEAHVSPGWILDEIRITILFWLSEFPFVKVIMGMFNPRREKVKVYT